MDDANWLTRREAEKLLNLPYNFLLRAAQRGEGPAYFKLSTKVVRYDRAELLRWREASLVRQP